MQLDKLVLVYYSPTGTTRRVVASIAQGIGALEIEHIDLTLPATMPSAPVDVIADVVAVGAPVYGGRVPATQMNRLRLVRGHGVPTVLVAVYGNRAFEDALVELEDWALDAGLVPIAGGAFVGEHSYHTQAAPIAPGRPDARDLARALDLGSAVRGRLEDASAARDLRPLLMPGNRPYRKRWRGDPVAPSTLRAQCTLCGRCAEVCPTGAIVVDDQVTTDADACTLCCACVKTCPTRARVMDDERVLRTAKWLSAEHRDRKEPELFL